MAPIEGKGGCREAGRAATGLARGCAPAAWVCMTPPPPTPPLWAGKWQYLFIESICNDTAVLEQNYK